jgi:F0F1-type ATP synthase delta subunit
MKNKKIITIWARLLMQTLDGKEVAQQIAILERVGAVLSAKKKDYLLPKIVEMVSEGFKKRAQLEITFARAQEEQTLQQIKRQLAGIGKKKTIMVVENPDIIGGFVAKTEDYIINASIADYLDQLRRQYSA